MQKLKFALILPVLFLSFQASADFYLEPYLGYESGTVKSTGTVAPTAGVDFGAKTTMLDLGTKIGFEFPGGFWLGGEYMMGMSGTYKYNNGAPDGKSTKTEYGAALGFNAP